MNLTHIVDNKRVAKDNNFLFEQFKHTWGGCSLLKLVEEELSFNRVEEGHIMTLTHKQMPHLVIKLEYKEGILHIYYKGRILDTIRTMGGGVYTKYKINNKISLPYNNYEETFNFIINKIRNLWELK
jgi:hypothetical protein